jgi:type I site-specific restriction-modification system R (restriction) subunit
MGTGSTFRYDHQIHGKISGFTGTRLITGEERVHEVFGDCVSVYNAAHEEL